MSNTGLRAVFYARVSTQEEQQLKALPKQIEECKDSIKRNGWILVDQYVDEGKSGTRTDGRKEYKRLYADMLEEKFDVIVIKSQDRLMRNTLDWYLFLDRLVNYDLRLYMYLENAFYKTEDKFITGIKAQMAEEYSRDLSKKLNNSNQRRIEKAKRGEKISAMGNSQMYGYRIVNGKWVIEPEEAAVVKKMYELYLELHSVRKVRNALNEQGYRNKAGKLFTEENVGRVIKNEKHKGWAILNRYHRDFDKHKIIEKPEEEWVIVKNDHEPIVSEEVWDAVNNEILSHRNEGNNKGRGKRMGIEPLSGKIYCGCCGKIMWKHQNRGSYKTKEGRKSMYKSYSQWYCSGKMGRGELACGDPATISGVQLNKYLMALADCFLDYSTVEYSKNLLKKRALNWLKDLRDQLSAPNDNEAIAAEIEKLEAKKGRLIDLYTDELITKEDFAAKTKELDNKLEEKRALIMPVEENPDIKAIEDTIKNIDAEIEALYADKAMVEEKKLQFIREHIKKIIVLSNRDVFVFLDKIAGAILFIDKGKAGMQIITTEAYIPEELREVGIGESEIVPFDRESMPFPHGRVHFKRHDSQEGNRGGILHCFCGHQYRGNLAWGGEPGLSAGP